ncbi:uncharacterized protein LOC129754611 isoform X2 [Uranotaenia lowii]|uniref:uncharacterized protein LOC129754611 isoform X2 n=1 Tax=Uranotaenia lowii TaxID=190385 RepID=UPI00247A922D|nr:uncharacterized protein LOC129754611 isoform X2 [Uranotaenia lowii]
MHRYQHRASVSSKSSLFLASKSSPSSGQTQQRRIKPVVHHLGKSYEGFNVDSGFETSEFGFVDFAEDVFNCQDEHPPKLIEEAAALFGLVAGTANRPAHSRQSHSGRSHLAMMDQSRRSSSSFQICGGGGGRFQRRRNRSRVSFDFDPSHQHGSVVTTADATATTMAQSGENNRRKQSIAVPPPQLPPASAETAAASPAKLMSADQNQNQEQPQQHPLFPKMTNYAKRADAMKALLIEMQAAQQLKPPHVLLLRFPDPELSKEIVQGYSTCIEQVTFHRPSTPRYCMVHLKADADVERVIQQLSNISFGTGKISVERKTKNIEQKPTSKPEEIDPQTLYIGNLPNSVTVYTVKQMFPAARRIDIGHAQRLKHTRYAFIRFHNVAEAISAFKANFNKVIDGQNVIIRFRRYNAPIAMPEDMKTPRTTKRQKGQPGQLFVSIEQKPGQTNMNGRQQQQQQPTAGEIHPSDTLNTIKTEILDEDCGGFDVYQPMLKIEPPEQFCDNLETDEDEDEIEDFLEEDEQEDLNLDEISTDRNYCEDNDTDLGAVDENYWTLEQLRNKLSNSDEVSTSASDSIKSDIFMEHESITITSCSTTAKKDKPGFIASRRRDDQVEDLFSALEPDDDLSI